MKKDLKIEMARYKKYNYSQNDIVLFLKRDGFSSEEINNNLDLIKDKDSNVEFNRFTYSFTLLFLLFTLLICISRIGDDYEFGNKILFVIISVFLSFIIYYYFKNEKTSIIIVILILCAEFLYFSYYSLIFIFNNLLQNLEYLGVYLIFSLLLIFLITKNIKIYSKN